MSEALNKYLTDKKILICGFGREGQSTLKYIEKNLPKASVTVASEKLDLYKTESFSKHTFIETSDFKNLINDYDLVIKSPGIAFIDYDIQTEVSCQSDLFLRFARGKKIGVTGTKGKTTTTTLIYKILSLKYKNVHYMGNMGIPVLDFIDVLEENSISVIEMSSHQLEFCKASPNISVITNIYEEHLDHYRDFDAYVDAKFNIIKYQKTEDFYVVKNNIKYYMDFSTVLSQKIEAENHKKFHNLNENLKGEHNKKDIDYAVSVAKLLDVEDEYIERALIEYEGLEHRMEKVGTFKDITFYNDSIATVPTAVISAIEALEDVDTLILGGMDRKISYSDFIEFLKKSKINNFLCMPETGNKIGRELEKTKNVFYFDDLEYIVKKAYEVTQKGKICLMSPAAPSYNKYRDFEEKGNTYKNFVIEIGKEHE
ncbi:MAG: UDP-N-acetylmuramoyl-L-alanine--D-glutamate ligase [Clostridia bacterium]|nr:UDP-N-acetylmuramoyl-L-alanine--D-glutamate ligase [Clostridia bacterium]